MDVPAAKHCEQPTGQRVQTVRSDHPSDCRPTESPGRIAELDSLRGLACLTIVVYHAMPHKVPGGWASIDLAFVVSGFLLTSILLKDRERGGSAGSSYLRRGLRIWPIYFMTILLLAAAAPILRRPFRLTELPYFLTYTQNAVLYWSANVPNSTPYLAHTWALAVEEQFFLLWVPLVLWLGRRGVIPLSLLIVGISFWARAQGFHWWLLLARGDGLALGSLLAALRLRQDLISHARWRIALAALGLTALAYLVGLTATGGMSTVGMPRWPAATLLAINLCCVAVVGMVVLHVGHPVLRPLRDRLLSRVGQFGYEIYLYHFIVILLSDDLALWLGLRGRPAWRLAVTGLAIVAVVAISRRYIQPPFRALKFRLVARETPEARPVAHRAFARPRSAKSAQEIAR